MHTVCETFQIVYIFWGYLAFTDLWMRLSHIVYNLEGGYSYLFVGI